MTLALTTAHPRKSGRWHALAWAFALAVVCGCSGRSGLQGVRGRVWVDGLPLRRGANDERT